MDHHQGRLRRHGRERAGVHSRDYDAERFAAADTLSIRLLNDDMADWKIRSPCYP